MSTFTPGPWGIRKESSVSAEFVESGDDQIAMLCDGDEKTRMANARLIAAAPDMLAALKAVHEPYRHLTEGALEDGILMEFGPPKPEKGTALLLVRAAIAKAEGASTRRDGPVLREGVAS